MDSDINQSIKLNSGLLIYIPAFNCADYIVGVIDEIPEKFWQIADILVIDNCSLDGTVESLQQARFESRWPGPIHLIQPDVNLGYAGSQKLAYKIPPELLTEFLPYIGTEYGIVYGFRDKSSYPDKEETPQVTYWIIKLLSYFESLVTGFKRKEWHNGFVMYSREFLSKVNLFALTDTYHIDGHIQYVAGELDEYVSAIPIWKRYKNYQQLKGLNRLTYIFHVLGLMAKFRFFGSGQGAVESDLVTVKYSIVSPAGNSTGDGRNS